MGIDAGCCNGATDEALKIELERQYIQCQVQRPVDNNKIRFTDQSLIDPQQQIKFNGTIDLDDSTTQIKEQPRNTYSRSRTEDKKFEAEERQAN